MADQSPALSGHLPALTEGLRSDIEIVHHSCSLCHLGNIVDRTGRNVSFNTANETIPSDAEASAMLKRKYRNHWATPKGV